ncbi:MAG: hypothetical protein HQ465_21100 [Rhodospirillales bacterium]|nr:hypothetical protein [Rhodospirillales bacterium]
MTTSEIRMWAIETKRRLEQEIRSQLVAELRREAEAAFQAQLEGEMRLVIEREIRARVAPQIERDVRSKATKAAIESLKSDPREMEAIEEQAREQVLTQARAEVAKGHRSVRIELLRELHDHILESEGQELRRQAEQEVRIRLQMEATSKIIEEMRDQAYSAEVEKIENAIRAEFRAKFLRLRAQLREEVEAEFRQEVITELSKGLAK